MNDHSVADDHRLPNMAPPNVVVVARALRRLLGREESSFKFKGVFNLLLILLWRSKNFQKKEEERSRISC
jgi:hypothetical protein